MTSLKAILLLLLSMPSSSTASSNVMETTRFINVHMLHWINNPPYYVSAHQPGLVSTLLEFQLPIYVDKKLKPGRVNFTFHENSHLHFKTEKEMLDVIAEKNKTEVLRRLGTGANSSDVFIAATTSVTVNKGHFQKLIICQPNKLIMMARRSDILLLVRFFHGISNSSGVLFFSIIVAINLAAVIWFIERKANDDFENDFGRGLWTSIWYCFVTMTTVGYGDKVPKHFLSRILCLAWMIFALMLCAMITANVLEAVQSEMSFVGEKVGYVRNQADESLVVAQFEGEPVAFDTYEEMLSALRDFKLKGAVMEGYQAGYLFGLSEEGNQDLVMVRKTVAKKTSFIYLYHNKTQTGLKFKKPTTMGKAITGRVFTTIVSFKGPYNIRRYYVRSLVELFDAGQDGGLVLVFSVFGGLLVGSSLFYEFLLKFITKRLLKH